VGAWRVERAELTDSSLPQVIDCLALLVVQCGGGGGEEVEEAWIEVIDSIVGVVAFTEVGVAVLFRAAQNHGGAASVTLRLLPRIAHIVASGTSDIGILLGILFVFAMRVEVAVLRGGVGRILEELALDVMLRRAGGGGFDDGTASVVRRGALKLFGALLARAPEIVFGEAADVELAKKAITTLARIATIDSDEETRQLAERFVDAMGGERGVGGGGGGEVALML
jgi:hypothetical protein